MTLPTALVMHEDCALHDAGWQHPEHQGRLPAIINALYLDTPDLQDVVLQLTGEHIDESALKLVHDERHIEMLVLAREQARRTQQAVPLDANETYMSPVTWDAMLADPSCDDVSEIVEQLPLDRHEPVKRPEISMLPPMEAIPILIGRQPAKDSEVDVGVGPGLREALRAVA